MKKLLQTLQILLLAAAMPIAAVANEGLFIDDTGAITTPKTVLFAPGKIEIGGAAIRALTNVDDTSDLNKPISIATQTALNLKLAINGNGSALIGLTKAQVGLSSVQDKDQTDAVNIVTGTLGAARLPVFIGDSGSGGTKGAVPAPAAGDAAANKFLKANGIWAPVTGISGGTVTSVSVTTANGVSGTVANSTTTPAISLTLGSITPSAASITGSGGAGFIDFAPQSTPPPTPATNHLRVYTTGLDLRFKTNSGTDVGILPPSAGGTPTYTLPPTVGGSGTIVAGPDDSHLPALDGSAVTGIPADVGTALSGKQSTSQKDVNSGYAGLDSLGKITSAARIPNIAESQVTSLSTDLASKESTANKGVPSGYAGLDSGGKVSVTNLPTVPISNGGTNATDAATAIKNLIPSTGGKTGQTLKWNGTGLEWLPQYSSVNVIVLTTSGTYVPSTGTNSIFVEAIGGGAGGGGAATASSNLSVGAGGGGGGYGNKWITSPAGSYSYTIGAGGAGGIGASGGSPGGATIFGTSLLTTSAASGGGTISAGTSQTATQGGIGGGVSFGDVQIPGAAGNFALRESGSFAISGAGGISGRAFGSGGQEWVGGSPNNGRVGVGYGGGGSGALTTSTVKDGGAGAAGVIIVTEFIVGNAP